MKKNIMILFLLCSYHLCAKNYLTLKEYYKWPDNEYFYVPYITFTDTLFNCQLDSIIEMRHKLPPIERNSSKVDSTLTTYIVTCNNFLDSANCFHLHVVETTDYDDLQMGELIEYQTDLNKEGISVDDFLSFGSSIVHNRTKMVFFIIKGIFEYKGYTFAWYSCLLDNMVITSKKHKHKKEPHIIYENDIMIYTRAYGYEYFYIYDNGHLNLINIMNAYE